MAYQLPEPAWRLIESHDGWDLAHSAVEPPKLVEFGRVNQNCREIQAFSAEQVLAAAAVAEALLEAAQDAADSIEGLLADMEHTKHDCGESGCPIRQAEQRLATLRAALAAA